MFSKTFNEQQAINKERLERAKRVKEAERATYEQGLELLLNQQESLDAVKRQILGGLK